MLNYKSTDESLPSVVAQTTKTSKLNNEKFLSNISILKTNLLSRVLSMKDSSNNNTIICQNAHYDYSIVVHFLDDTERTFYMDRRCKGIDLLNEVFSYLDLDVERKYFGLLIEDVTQDVAYRWLDSTKTLKKQLTTDLFSYHLYFKVRFFVADPSREIDDEFTKYLYVLQLKKDLLTGKIICPRSTAILLASYVIQSELGDYDLNKHQSEYLKDFHFVPFQNSDFEKEVQQYHEQHRGQTPADAENNYLRIATSLEMYGMELHKASVKVSNPNNTIYNSIIELYVGVSSIGITIFQNSVKINIFYWDQITKISFKRRTFYIQLIKYLDSSDSNSIVFTLRSYRCCKYLWKSCVDHHTFFRLSSIPRVRVFQLTNKFCYQTDVIPNEMLMSTGEKRRKSFERVSNRRAVRTINGSSTLPVSHNNATSFFLSASDVSMAKSDQNFNKTRSPPPPKPPRQSSFNEANEYKPKNGSLSNSSPMISSSGIPVDEESPDSNIVSVKLTPGEDGRFGFNIKSGKSRQAHAVISKVVANTPASRASLHEGDVILAINNIDVETYSSTEIIDMIRQSRQYNLGELELSIMKSPMEKTSLKDSLESLRSEILNASLTQRFHTIFYQSDNRTFSIASQKSNLSHNRYINVLPYDQTRVILKTHPINDYINANFINMPIHPGDTVNRYIATQGPLETTCESFWRMVWEQECCLIIMLTTLFEDGRIKCHQYWPNQFQTIHFGSLSIRCIGERREREISYRELVLTNSDSYEERLIYQIQSESWPDHGIPQTYASFVDLVLEIRELRKANKHVPILVHCSAGIGRTGVLILMETALCLIEANQPVNPPHIVRCMREQRLGMIQTASQYQFVCEAILYAYDHGLIEPNE